MAPDLLLGLPVLVPLALAAALLLSPVARAAAILAPAGAVPALLVATLAPDTSADLPWLLLGTRLRLDASTRPFLLLAGAVWLAAAVHARAYLREDRKLRGFLAFWSLALAGNVGLVVAGDAASFYLCFAVMTFASYGLVVHEGTGPAATAGRVYLVFAVLGELAVFVALALGAHAAGSLLFEDVARSLAASPSRDAIVAAAFLGFGVKAGALGLHVWMPLAYPEAPTPASAVLSGVMVKAGMLGWLNLLPAEPLAGWGRIFVAAGMAGAFYGVVVGLTQRRPKAILAYSSVSQMGIALVGVGAALGDPTARATALSVLPLFALHHGVSKAALFLGAGLAKAAGPGRRAWAWSLALPGLTLAAAPLTSGAVAKGAMKGLVAESGAGGATASVLLAVSSAGTALLLAHLLHVLHSSPPDPHAHAPRRGEAAPYLGLLVLSFAVPLLAGSPGLVAPTAKELWPLALAAAAAITFWRLPAPAIPEGDLLSLYRRVVGSLVPSFARSEPGPVPFDAGWIARVSAWARATESRVVRIGAGGVAFAALLVALHLVLS